MKYFQLIDSQSIHEHGEQKILKQADISNLLEASEIIEEAKAQAQALKERTEAEAIELKENARREGLQEGLETFNGQLLHLSEKLRILDHELQKNILPLALKSCEKILAAELQLNPDAILSIIRKSIRPLIESQHVKIWVNKSDRSHLLSKKEEIKAMFERVESLAIEEKHDLEDGSCIIETEVGIINASLEQQLKALASAFKAFEKK